MAIPYAGVLPIVSQWTVYDNQNCIMVHHISGVKPGMRITVHTHPGMTPTHRVTLVECIHEGLCNDLYTYTDKVRVDYYDIGNTWN